MATGRMQNSLKNLSTGFLSRIVNLFLGMVVRTIFIKTLGNEYLSVNGLYSNILNMLSLAELGFGTAMVYNMYKPLAENDMDKLAALMALYKKVYQIIGLVVLVIGLGIIPFMDLIIKDPPNISHLTFYYILFLLNSVASYWFFAYKRSILVADQKEHICNNFYNITNLCKFLFQIALLIIFKNFTVYLLVQFAFTIINNFLIARYSDKRYVVSHNKQVISISPEEKKNIWKDVKALTISKLCHVLLNGTDNLIISAFVGISWVGLLSNFTLIVESVTSILCQITQAITASLGNYFVKEDKKSGYELFKKIDFLNFWLYGFSTIALIVLLNPFITIWLGQDFVLPIETVVAISINFFIAGFMNTLWTFRSTLGLFTQGQYRPLIVSIINIVLSIFLSYKFGITGVLAATAISRICVNIWYDPLIIHKYGFEVSVKPFFKRYFHRIFILIFITICLSILADRLVFSNGITALSFLIMIVLTVIIPNLIFYLCFSRTQEFEYFFNLIKSFFYKTKTVINKKG